MAQLNRKPRYPDIFTHEGARASPISPEAALRRSVMSCLLWEDEFYEDGEAIAERIIKLAEAVKTETLAAIAIEARNGGNLRHVPLFLAACLARRAKGKLVGSTIARVIQRADELPEFLAIYAKLNEVEPKDLKKKLSAQVKKGLAAAFLKFDEYQLAKYDRGGSIRLRDALFLCHAKPEDSEQEALWARLVRNELAAPDTWEIALSTGKDKKETFTRLLQEEKLGYLALLRNLRNMTQAGVDKALIETAILARKGAHRVLPFRYIAAARACPQLEPVIDKALSAAIGELAPLSGHTVILADVSGSMAHSLSKRSDLTRMDAAAALASIINGDISIYSFSNHLAAIPPRRGMAGVDAVVNSQPHGGTELLRAVDQVLRANKFDRMIVISDEQAAADGTNLEALAAGQHARFYMINVGSYQNGVGYGGKWVHIDGFSEQVLKFISAYET